MKHKILDLQPSQIFVNQGKIDALSRKLTEQGPEELQPIPIKKFDGIDNNVITDGHTRLYVLYQNGIAEVKTELEDLEMDWMIYRLCVWWAQQRGIFSVDHLEPMDQFEYPKKWIGACHQAEKVLDQLFPERSYFDIIDYDNYPELKYEVIVSQQTLY